jgi:lipid A 4'-phosphatase
VLLEAPGLERERTTTAGKKWAIAGAMFWGSIIAGVGCALLFYVEPNLDLAVAKLLYISDHKFIGTNSNAFTAVRHSFSALFYAVCTVTVIGCVITHAARRRWLTLSSRSWLYLAVCLLMGPLTITNLGFKDHWGRPRPSTVVEFGGKKAFDPPLVPSNQCTRNCSFVSGEASSIFIVCFAAAFLFPNFALSWALAGIVLGSAAGFVRMAEGGHFLSDVMFAGVLMALTAAILQLLFSELAGDDDETF